MLPIVYVHLGDKAAPHLIDSIRQSRRMAPTTEVFAILTGNSVMSDDVKDAGAEVVYGESLPRTEVHAAYVGTVRRRLGKKRGFWRFATERFFLIEELMLARGIQRVLHIESDNLIFFDPAEIADKLAALYPGMAAPFWNDTMCIPGVVYVGAPRALSDLTAYLVRRVRDEAQRQARWYRPWFLNRVRMGLVLNDMNMLAAFKGEAGPEKMNLLPMVPPEYQPAASTVPHAYSYSYGYAELGMIFDSLTFGPAIGGLDPEHHTVAAGKELVAEYSYVDGADFGYDRLNFRDHTSTPYLTYKGNLVRLASLHNHAKASIL